MRGRFALRTTLIRIGVIQRFGERRGSWKRRNGGRRVVKAPARSAIAFVQARYGSDERRREMAEFLAYRGFVGREPGRSEGSLDKALETLDAMNPAQLTLLELRMQSARRDHESDYDPYARG
jgi:hypothetical protein